jgi:hypothetical protein
MNEIIPIIDNLQPGDFIFFTPHAWLASESSLRLVGVWEVMH